MAEKNTGLLKGLLTVLILSVLVFGVIYFFFPSVSLKYFGVSLDMTKAVEETVSGVLSKVNYMTEDERKAVSEYLSSDEGKAFIKNVSPAIRGGADAIADFNSSESFTSFKEHMSSVLSPSSFERLTEGLENTASKLLGSN